MFGTVRPAVLTSVLPLGWSGYGGVMRRVLIVVVIAVGGLLAVACSGSGSGAATTTVSTQAPQSGTVSVSVIDNNFRPQDITVTKGSTVVWTNEGRAEHNIVAFGPTPFHVDTKSFPPGSTYSWVADSAGTFRYYCSIHGTATAAMYGSVTVVEP
jgi:plastocyanin